jgi:CubicO group peptidase (beta-lactamase class C family)
MLQILKQQTSPVIAFILILCTPVISRAQNFTKVDDWLKDNTGQMGGRAFLVIYKEGKIVYSHAVNDMTPRQKIAGRMMARRQGKEADTQAYTLNTRQPIASCSKWLSAALIMTFVDEGTIKPADTVGKFLPVLTRHGKGSITISQCLSHTTGIKAAPLLQSLEEMKTINSMDEAMEKIAALPMEGKPGKVFHYSNAGLQIAGAVLEKITGKRFETLFAERIAKPLEMKNTDFGNGRVALPAGGAFSTPQDYLNFLTMILNKGVFKGKRILSENSIAEMQVNRVTGNVAVAYSPAEAGDSGYGYGEWVLTSSTRDRLSPIVSSPGLFGSFPWVDNERKYCAFLMTVYIKPQGRGERYKELKDLVDGVLK